MDDVKDLLERALTDGHGPSPDQPIDAAGDLARGRSLLRRRRLAGLAGAVTVVAVVAIVPWATHAAGSGTTGSAEPIALIAYQGEQAPGYQVAEVPSGWVVQGGNAYALVIAPQGDPDQSIGSFLGKLVVMLQSRDASAPTRGASQPVAGQPGRFDVQGDTQILTFQGGDHRWVVIQAPTSLGWDSARLAQFAAGVQVLGNAQQGRG